MNISLSKFIKTVGDDAAAELFGVTSRAAKSWRLLDRVPSPKNAIIIVEKTVDHPAGRVTFADIYYSAG